jgi:DNA processing protein
MKDGAGQTLSDAQRLDWLRLIRSQSVGPRTFRALINQFGGAKAALEALPDLSRRSGGGAVRVCSPAEAEAELTILRRMGARLIASGEPDYPRLLAAIDSAPPLLAVLGDVSALRLPAVAIVGARNASALGMRFAGQMARDLGDAGLVIVSGLARGIDAAAHEGALRRGTVAVLAGGLARLYPPEHADLARRIAETGCTLSEMPVEWTATGRDFPRRNRIVSGLSYGTVVIEAALRSGSLITARFAGEQGREVFAVPGSPLDPRSEGTNRLIREGATLTTGARDVIEALAPVIASGEPPLSRVEEGGGTDEEPLWDELAGYGVPDSAVAGFEAPRPPPIDVEARIVALLGPAPTALDDLVRTSGLSLREVQVAVLELELAGRLERHGENRFSRLR